MPLIVREHAVPILSLGSGASLFPSSSSKPPLRTSLGLVTYSLLLHQKATAVDSSLPRLTDPFTFLQYAHALGAGGMQFPLGIQDKTSCAHLREFAERHHLFIEGNSILPQDDSDSARFEQELITARNAGADIIRTVVIPGRRYEQFKSYTEYKQAADRARELLIRAEPLARKHKIRLAVENHKDQRISERLALLQELDSQWVGACLDLGNNMALLEDPYETAAAFAPWVHTVHFKDQAVAAYPEGFLLADVPLGRGCIDLRAIVSLLQKRAPKARLHLELITRDPLKVPLLSSVYWPSFDRIYASELAATLALLKARSSVEPFAQISALSLQQQLEAEQHNLLSSFTYAVHHLGLSA